MNDIIKMTMGELSIALEGEVMKAVQKVGIDVDKDKLLEALQLADTIVRCKDCKHCKRKKGTFRGEPIFFYRCEEHNRDVESDDFCSWGEER